MKEKITEIGQAKLLESETKKYLFMQKNGL